MSDHLLMTYTGDFVPVDICDVCGVPVVSTYDSVHAALHRGSGLEVFRRAELEGPRT